ncbi:MAG TPA: sugar phosphate isomerase/epimerase [Spirochaetia bacterium]|nr:sugar phosphate isomerase/epimerase [Spirochaetia bacterium]
MEIRWIFATWGMPGKSLDENLDIGREAGFNGVETGVPADAPERARFRSRLDDLGLDLVAQQWTTGADGAAHARSFEEQYRRSVEAKPLFVNSHTGRDIFPLSENLLVFEKARALERQFGVPVRHETHRGRPTFSAPSTMALLDAAPGTMLTADFSHWCCVHESLLEDLGPQVSRVIAASRHVHARVGHAESPQVTDPRAPEWKKALDAHVAWWQAIVDSRRKAGDAFLTVCPEFGPPDYQVTLPGTGKPISDLWEINRAMRDILRERLRV